MVFSFPTSSLAQTIQSTDWNGDWVGEGTLFKIGVSVENNVMKVAQIESLGFVWTSQDGEVDGNIVRVNVEYAGVKGIIQAELINPNHCCSICCDMYAGFYGGMRASEESPGSF